MPTHHRHPKHEHRQHALARRAALSPAERIAHSATVCALASTLPELRSAETLLMFASFGTEVDTSPLIAWALTEGKTVCLPRVLAPRHMAAFHVTDPDTHLLPGAWGIPEPREDLQVVAPDRLDAVVVPGAVFDTSGKRCGYGGGFYDTYLPLTRADTRWVALAFETQVIADLPCEPHDLAVSVVVTETRVIRAG
jgi:5-formyltetrahydrofolate cyclo-ligase